MTELPTNPKFIDLPGQTFGKLKVISYAGEVDWRHCWNCVCSCGELKVVDGGNLRSENTRSCGCLRRRGRRARL